MLLIIVFMMFPRLHFAPHSLTLAGINVCRTLFPPSSIQVRKLITIDATAYILWNIIWRRRWRSHATYSIEIAWIGSIRRRDIDATLAVDLFYPHMIVGVNLS